MSLNANGVPSNSQAPTPVPDPSSAASRGTLFCSSRPLGRPLDEFLHSPPWPVPGSWPHDEMHLAERPLDGLPSVWWIVVWFGYRDAWREDVDELRTSGISIAVAPGVDISRLSRASFVLLVHRHALDGQPGIVAALPIEKIEHTHTFTQPEQPDG